MLGDFSLLNIVILIGVLLVSMSFHEAMHAWVGFKLGDTTAADDGRISLNPLRHIDPLMTVALPVFTILAFGAPILAAKPVPVDYANLKWDELGGALVAIAGPLTNLAIAIVAVLIGRLVVPTGVFETILGTTIVLNVALFVFNMIPIPPLDGSRVLRAVSPEGIQNFLDTIEPYGIIIIFGLVLFGSNFGLDLGAVISRLNEMVLNLLGV